MFGKSIAKSKGLLFVTYELSATLRNLAQGVQREVEGMDANRFLKASSENLKQNLVERFSVTPIRLLRDQWHADHKEVQIDVRHDRMRWIEDRSRPVLVSGERIEVRVPFDGDAELFYASANTWSSNPPRAEIEKNELVLRYDSPADQPRDVRPLVDRALIDIEQYLGWQRSMIDAHNTSLPNIAEQAIQQRRVRLVAQSQRADTLGIPSKRRDDAPKT
jgi:hypothetical protein